MGWLDRSHTDQQRMHEVLSMFSERESRDELRTVRPAPFAAHSQHIPERLWSQQRRTRRDRARRHHHIRAERITRGERHSDVEGDR